MIDTSYWQKQTPNEPLFPNIEWSRPEQKAKAGKLGIIGGNKLGFAGVAEAYSVAIQYKVGAAKVLLPDALRKDVPKAITDAVFAPSNPSGGLSKDAVAELAALGAWADGILMIGDAGRNSETAILYEQFIQGYHGQLTITRDAIDLLKNSSQIIVERPNTLVIAAFAQLQKLFQNVYFPKVITFSMQLSNLVEVLHKFTLSYPITIVTLHKDILIVAHEGKISTTPWNQPIAIWRGTTAAKAAAYWLWNSNKPFEAVTGSL